MDALNESMKRMQRAITVTLSRYMSDLIWSQIYHDTIVGSEWLLDKSISPGGSRCGIGGWAVGYNFLYALYRILDEMHPRSILEMGLGQSSKLTGQYAGCYGVKHVIVEHDREWVDFFCNGWKRFSRQTRIMLTPLVESDFEGEKYFAYRDFHQVMKMMNTPMDLVLIDGPFGGAGPVGWRGTRSRRDIVGYLPQILSPDFVIMVDDCGRKGEQNLLMEIKEILSRHGVEYAAGIYAAGGTCHTGVIVSPKWKFFTSM